MPQNTPAPVPEPEETEEGLYAEEGEISEPDVDPPQQDDERTIGLLAELEGADG